MARGVLEVPSNNLPLQLTSFIGRDAELTEARHVLSRTSLLTLTGAGGCGKTRLALRLAEDVLPEFLDGVWSADLAPITDPEFVLSAVAAVLDVQQVHGERLVETLGGYLRERDVLLVLDNCEHLASACAALASSLLSRCPALKVVATSREPLGVHGEVLLRVPSLALPATDAASLDDLAGVDAVELFIDRARSVRSTFAATPHSASAIARICRRLDGIPLAIELAAARTQLLGVEQIAERLEDRFRLLTGGERLALPRHRTLEASVVWSFDLLSEAERVLLARLSVFADGFGLDAVEEVAWGDPVERSQILDLLSALVDRSLVQAEERDGRVRFGLLETTRAYAQRLLSGRAETETTRDRHLDFYVDLAGRARAGIDAGEFGAWVSRLADELDNFRLAMDWADTAGEAEKSLRIVGAASMLLWMGRMHFAEAERRIEAALANTEGVDSAVLARALVSSLAVWTARDLRRGLECADEAVRLVRPTPDNPDLAFALCERASAGGMLGLEPSLAELEEALDLARAADDRIQILWCLMRRGTLTGLRDRPSAGRPHLREALDLAERWDRARDGAWARQFLALYIELPAGELIEAERLQVEALAVARDIRERLLTATALAGLSRVAALRGNLVDAKAFSDEAVDAARRSGATVAEARALLASGWAAQAVGDIAAAESVLGRAVELSEAVGMQLLIAHVVATLGRLAVDRRDLASARGRLDRGADVAQGLPWPLSAVLLADVRHARLAGDGLRAHDRAHEALRVAAASENVIAIVDALEALAGLAAARESFAESTRLFGAADRLREDIGYARLPADQAGWQADLADAQRGSESPAAAWTEGRAMSTELAIAYAQRGRGKRKRPSTGWDGLTPAEREVVRLVAEGLSNQEIARQLVVTRNTVKTHLSHVFAKLDVSSRAELAAEATRRGE